MTPTNTADQNANAAQIRPSVLGRDVAGSWVDAQRPAPQTLLSSGGRLVQQQLADERSSSKG